MKFKAFILSFVLLAFAGLVTFPQQILRPNADVDVGGWRNADDDTTTNLYALINETVVDDASSIYADADTTYKGSLTAGIDPLSSANHIVKYRAFRFSDGIVQVCLYQTTTLVACDSPHYPNEFTAVEYTFTLTGGEADSITNYAALRLHFEASSVTGGVFVSWAVFEIPNAPAGDKDGMFFGACCAVTAFNFNNFNQKGGLWQKKI